MRASSFLPRPRRSAKSAFPFSVPLRSTDDTSTSTHCSSRSSSRSSSRGSNRNNNINRYFVLSCLDLLQAAFSFDSLTVLFGFCFSSEPSILKDFAFLCSSAETGRDHKAYEAMAEGTAANLEGDLARQAATLHWAAEKLLTKLFVVHFFSPRS